MSILFVFIFIIANISSNIHINFHICQFFGTQIYLSRFLSKQNGSLYIYICISQICQLISICIHFHGGVASSSISHSFEIGPSCLRNWSAMVKKFLLPLLLLGGIFPPSSNVQTSFKGFRN